MSGEGRPVLSAGGEGGPVGGGAEGGEGRDELAGAAGEGGVVRARGRLGYECVGAGGDAEAALARIAQGGGVERGLAGDELAERLAGQRVRAAAGRLRE